MSDALILIGGDGPDAAMAWARVSADGAIESQGTTNGSAAPPAAPPSRTVLILPGAEARLKRLELPARTEAQARAGAPFLFEGALADDQDMHFAVGAAQDASGNRLVAAMSAQRLRQWLERCRAFGADPHLVVLDCTVWPTASGEVAIAAFPIRVIVAAGGHGGFSIEPALAAPVFQQWLREAHVSPSRIVLRGGDAAAWRAALGASADRLEVQPAADPVAELARGAIEAPETAPNLRQGDFAVAGRRSEPVKLWRFAVLLAAAALLLQIGAQLISGVRDHQAATQIMAAAERDFRAIAPGRVVNLRAQVAALTNQFEQAGRHPVLVVSEPMVRVLRQQPLVRIDAIRHEAPSRTVRVQISAPDAAAPGAVAAALRGEGMAVETRELPPVDGRYAMELSLEAPQ